MSGVTFSIVLIFFSFANVDSSCNNAIASLQWKVAQLETNVGQKILHLMNKLNELETTVLQRLEKTSFSGDNHNYTQLIKRKRRTAGKFVGCFKGRQGNEMFRGHINILKNNSVDTCISICKENYFVYAATHREYCSCGNAFPSLKPNMFHKVIDTQCNYSCDGNSTQKCGGEWPLKSVYETGIEQYAFNNIGKEFNLELPQASQNIYFDVDVKCDYCYDDD